MILFTYLLVCLLNVCLNFCQVRTRGLPEDHVGSVRVVTIDGLEVNMCCGTHVSDLSHLQVNVIKTQYLQMYQFIHYPLRFSFFL